MATVKLVQNDTRPALEFSVREDGQAVDLTGATVKFYMKDSAGSAKLAGAACTITDATNGKCQYVWQAGDLDTAGTFTGEVQVTFSDGRIQTGYDTIALVVRAELPSS